MVIHIPPKHPRRHKLKRFARGRFCWLAGHREDYSDTGGEEHCTWCRKGEYHWKAWGLSANWKGRWRVYIPGRPFDKPLGQPWWHPSAGGEIKLRGWEDLEPSGAAWQTGPAAPRWITKLLPYGVYTHVWGFRSQNWNYEARAWEDDPERERFWPKWHTPKEWWAARRERRRKRKEDHDFWHKGKDRPSK